MIQKITIALIFILFNNTILVAQLSNDIAKYKQKKELWNKGLQKDSTITGTLLGTIFNPQYINMQYPRPA